MEKVYRFDQDDISAAVQAYLRSHHNVPNDSSLRVVFHCDIGDPPNNRQMITATVTEVPAIPYRDPRD